MQNDFFQKLAGLMNGIPQISMVISLSNEGIMTISVLPKTDSKKETLAQMVPLVVAGTPQEMDSELIATLDKPLAMTSGFFASIKQFEKSMEEAKENSEMERKKKDDEKKEREKEKKDREANDGKVKDILKRKDELKSEIIPDLERLLKKDLSPKVKAEAEEVLQKFKSETPSLFA